MPAKPRPRKSSGKSAPKTALKEATKPALKLASAAKPKRAARAGANAGKKAPAKTKWQDSVVTALEDAKALDIVLLDVRKLTDIADYMIVASGTSTRHVAGVADKLVDHMRALGRKPIGMEGKEIGEWVLIDFGDVVAHIMRPQTRDFYNLEKLWAQGFADSASARTRESAVIELEQHVRQRRKPASS